MKIDIVTNIESSLPKYVIKSSESSLIVSIEKPITETMNFSRNDNKQYEESYIENGEFPEGKIYKEGSQKSILVNAYERSTSLRKACIKNQGVTCCVCGMNFKETYGNLGDGFIEVHHCVPLKNIGRDYNATVDDLRPVCSNCHSMLHRNRDDNLTIEELRIIYLSNKSSE